MMTFPSDMSAYGPGDALTESKHANPRIGGTMINFSTEDYAVEEARVADAGGQVVRPQFSIGDHGWVTLCQDTEGNLFGLGSMK